MRSWAHPIQIRKRAVAAMESGELTVEQVAALFDVGYRTLYDWRYALRDRGTLTPLKHQSGNKPRVSAEDEDVVRKLVAEHPDATIEETAVLFVERTGRRCSRSSMGRALLRLGLTRKKRR